MSVQNHQFYPLLTQCLDPYSPEFPNFIRFSKDMQIQECRDFLDRAQEFTRRHEELKAFAKKMYEDFVNPEGKTPINIDSKIMQTVKKTHEDGGYDGEMFLAAETQIKKILLNDSMLKYEDWLTQHGLLLPAQKRELSNRLCNAAWNNQMSELETLARHPNFSEFVNYPNERGQSAFYCAARNNCTEALLLLLRTPLVQLRSSQPQSAPFGGMSSSSGSSVFMPLPALKLDLDARVPPHESTALHAACFSGYAECAALLLLAGADVTLKNKNGGTARQETLTRDVQEVWQMFESRNYNGLREKYTLVDTYMQGPNKTKPRSISISGESLSKDKIDLRDSGKLRKKHLSGEFKAALSHSPERENKNKIEKSREDRDEQGKSPHVSESDFSFLIDIADPLINKTSRRKSMKLKGRKSKTDSHSSDGESHSVLHASPSGTFRSKDDESRGRDGQIAAKDRSQTPPPRPTGITTSHEPQRVSVVQIDERPLNRDEFDFLFT